MNHNPFKLPLKHRWQAKFLESLLGLSKLVNLYEERPKDIPTDVQGEHLLKYAIQGLDVKLHIDNEHLLQDIPSNGPLIFIANHPLGGLEGIMMTHQLLKYRPDLKVLTNEMLTTIPEFKDLFIGVDILSKDQNSIKKNSSSLRKICKHISQGGAVLIYPAGMVSILNLKSWKIFDRPWNNIVGNLVKRYKAHCMPFYVEGENRKFFYISGLIHKKLRTAQLPRELVNKQGSTLTIRAGQMIGPNEVNSLDDEGATNYLRLATYMLGRKHKIALKHHLGLNQNFTTDPTIVSNKTPHLQLELQQLHDCKLLDHNDFSVYCAPFHRIKYIMKEIAEVRELTFRAVGEGTGKALDSDSFDAHYLHLFVWDHTKNNLVGAYRLGKVDEIVEKHGIKGLYSRTLYQYDKKFITKLGQAIELGRSFISLEYQRHPKTLDLLWRGIGAYIANNPQYHTLFGCVSISQEHSLMARAFISDSMMNSFQAEEEYLSDVRPLTPLKVKGKIWSLRTLETLANITVINKLIGKCDPGKSIPVLLRQYLALNGRFIGFTLDSTFNNSLTGLILVDLRKTPQKYLKRYLGKAGYIKFLSKRNDNEAAA